MDPAKESKDLDNLVSNLTSHIRPGDVVFGLGNDIAEVRRIADLIDRPGGSFLTRSFTPAEIAEASRKARPEIHFAGKWAAKEAVYKALKLRWIGSFSWKEIEVLSPEGTRGGRVREDGGHGRSGSSAPQVRLSKKLLDQLRADRLEYRQANQPASLADPEDPQANRPEELKGRPTNRPVERKSMQTQALPRLLISISHCDEYAFAVALAVTADVEPADEPTLPSVASPTLSQDGGETENVKTTNPEVEKAAGP